VEIQKSTRWRHLYSHKQSNDTKYGHALVSWLAVDRGATDGPPHFVIMLNLYIDDVSTLAKNSPKVTVQY